MQTYCPPYCWCSLTPIHPECQPSHSQLLLCERGCSATFDDSPLTISKLSACNKAFAFRPRSINTIALWKHRNPWLPSNEITTYPLTQHTLPIPTPLPPLQESIPGCPGAQLQVSAVQHMNRRWSENFGLDRYEFQGLLQRLSSVTPAQKAPTPFIHLFVHSFTL